MEKALAQQPPDLARLFPQGGDKCGQNGPRGLCAQTTHRAVVAAHFLAAAAQLGAVQGVGVHRQTQLAKLYHLAKDEGFRRQGKPQQHIGHRGQACADVGALTCRRRDWGCSAVRGESLVGRGRECFAGRPRRRDGIRPRRGRCRSRGTVVYKTCHRFLPPRGLVALRRVGVGAFVFVHNGPGFRHGFAYGVQRSADVVFGVRGGKKEAQTVRAFFDGREGDGHDVDPAFEQGVGPSGRPP